MSAVPTELKLQIPAEAVRKSAGFSYDIGGSAMKIVYRTKEDYDEALTKTGAEDKATVRMVMFSRLELDKAIEYIRERAYVTRTPGEETVVYTTGVGGYQFKEKMEKCFNVKMVNFAEMDCFNSAARYLLQTVPLGELDLPYDTTALVKPMAESRAILAPFLEMSKQGGTAMKFEGGEAEKICGDLSSIDGILDAFQSDWTDPWDPTKPITEQNDIFPFAFGFFGSAFAMMKVDRDWSFSPIDISFRGGRSCLAMANMFLGIETFDELIELAARGDSDAVDYCSKDIQNESMTAHDGNEPRDMYNLLSEADVNTLCFAFGKGVNKKKSDFRKEDLAAALLRFYCGDMAMFIDKSLHSSMFCDIKHVFLAGGFPNNDVCRRMLTRELSYRAAGIYVLKMRAMYKVHFLRHGPYLGCLGSLLNVIQPVDKKPET